MNKTLCAPRTCQEKTAGSFTETQRNNSMKNATTLISVGLLALALSGFADDATNDARNHDGQDGCGWPSQYDRE
jgi:hypothetical protein